MTINEENKIKELIKRRRLQILVHSYIYYRLNSNIISNEIFDNWASELIALQNKYPLLSSHVEKYDIFKNFLHISCCAELPLDDDERLAARAIALLRESNKKQ